MKVFRYKKHSRYKYWTVYAYDTPVCTALGEEVAKTMTAKLNAIVEFEERYKVQVYRRDGGAVLGLWTVKSLSGRSHMMVTRYWSSAVVYAACRNNGYSHKQAGQKARKGCLA